MKYYYLFFICAISLLMTQSCNKQQINKAEQNQMHKHTNRLIEESSPYLLQHAHNPVDWFPWGDEALDKAKRENKMMIVSIGYSSCHWCHVMEHETFEDSTAAAIMNQSFVSIKVDREERPDIDQVYMDAAQMITGRGGWPLNVICTPDGKPIYAGTYFPKEQWINLLDNLVKTKEKNPEKINEQAKYIYEHLSKMDEISGLNAADFSNNKFDEWVSKAQAKLDYKWGGRLGAPKFVMPTIFEFFLAYQAILDKKNESQKLKAYIVNSLHQIANGGIHDHIGGGFARYATDERWKVPHFEKMLYDNAQLIPLYAKAAKRFNVDRFEKITASTINFLKREMQSEEGYFYSAFDADSEGEEGKFYVWNFEKDLDGFSEDEIAFLKEFMNFKKAGNWEGNNIPLILPEKQKAFLLPENQKQWLPIKKKLFEIREKRKKPLLDDKCILSWNVLTLKGMAIAGDLLSNEAWLEESKLMTKKLLNEMVVDGQLKRIWKDHTITIDAFLEDYATLIDLLITLYQIDTNQFWLLKAQEFSTQVIQNFSHEANNYFYFTSINQEQLIKKKIELSDNVIPASNSIMAHNLFRLGLLFDNKKFSERSEKMVSKLASQIDSGGLFYANWLRLYQQYLSDPYEVAVVGHEAKKVLRSLRKQVHQSAIFLGAETEKETETLPLLENKWLAGETMIYVCQNKTCQRPTTKVDIALKQIK